MNRLNIPTIKQQQSEWIFFFNSPPFCLKDTHFRFKYTNELKVKGRKNTYIQALSKRGLQWKYLHKPNISYGKIVTRAKERHSSSERYSKHS